MGGVWQPGAPASGPYVIIGTDGRLSNARTLTGAANQITVTDGGAGSTVTLTIPNTFTLPSASPTFTGLTLSGLTATRLASTDGSKALASTSLATWVAGTANQIIVADDGDGTITLSGPQNVHTGASPTFAGLTVSGLTASRLTSTDGSKALASAALFDWVAGTANQITIADDGDGTITVSGAQNLHTEATPTFSGLSTTGQAAHRIDPYGTAAGNTGEIRWLELAANGTNYVGFKSPDALAGNVIWTLPSADGTNAQILQTNGSGVLSWVTGGGAPTGASYVVIALDATLTAERVLTGTANQITLTDGGANGNVTLALPQNIHSGASPTFTGLTLSGLTAGSVPFVSTGGVISQDNAALFWNATTDRLGVGTASPIGRIALKQASDAFSSGLHIERAAATNVWSLAVGGDNNLYFGSDTAPSGSFTTRAVMTTGGRFGIGIAPSFALHLSTTENSPQVFFSGGSTVRVGINSTANTGFGLYIGSVLKWSNAVYRPAGTNFDYVLYNDQTATNALFIDGDTNNVSIGHISPNGKFHLQTGAATTIGAITQGAAAQSANLTEWQDSATAIYGTVSENGYFTTRKTAAPADGELATGELAYWFDSTAGAAKVMFKGKDANGTVVTGSVILS